MIIETADGQRHEVLLPKGEHLLEYVRNADRTLGKEELFGEMIEALQISEAFVAQEVEMRQDSCDPEYIGEAESKLQIIQAILAKANAL